MAAYNAANMNTPEEIANHFTALLPLAPPRAPWHSKEAYFCAGRAAGALVARREAAQQGEDSFHVLHDRWQRFAHSQPSAFAALAQCLILCRMLHPCVTS